MFLPKNFEEEGLCWWFYLRWRGFPLRVHNSHEGSESTSLLLGTFVVCKTLVPHTPNLVSRLYIIVLWHPFRLSVRLYDKGMDPLLLLLRTKRLGVCVLDKFYLPTITIIMVPNLDTKYRHEVTRSGSVDSKRN